MSFTPIGIFASAAQLFGSLKALFVTKNPKIYGIDVDFKSKAIFNSPVQLNDVKFVPSSESGLPDDTYLVAGNNGYVLRSTDGLTWTTISTGISSDIGVIDYGGGPILPPGYAWSTVSSNVSTLIPFFTNAYAPGVHYLGGRSTGSSNFLSSFAVAAYSTDGATWTSRTIFSTLTGTHNISSFSYGEGILVATDTRGRIARSLSDSDFQTWSNLTSNFGNTAILSSAYGDGLWVAAGSTGQMRTSTNGSTWVTVTSNFGTTIIQSVAYANGLWVAAGSTGQMRTSANGSTWVTVTSNFGTTIIRSVAYGNGLWVAAGDVGQMRTSTNGSTWVTVTSNFGNSLIRSVAYGDGLWVAAGATGQMRTSTNGSTWVTVASNFGNSLVNSSAYGNGIWVAVGAGAQIRISSERESLRYFLAAGKDLQLSKSTNSIEWTTIAVERGPVVSPAAWDSRANNLPNAITDEITAAGSNKYIFGENGLFVLADQITEKYTQVYREPTTSWNTVTSGFATTQSVLSVARGNGLWVATGVSVGGGGISVSTDGSSWEGLATDIPRANSLRSVAYGNNLWVAVGTVWRVSTNGVNWFSVTSGAINANGVAYGDGLWVAVGAAGGMVISTNGTVWDTVTSNFGGTAINSVAYGDGLWVAAGSTGQMRTSTNGSTWVTVTSNFGTTIIRSVAYGNGLWVAAGSTGQMRTSANGSTWVTVTSNFGNTVVNTAAYGDGRWVAAGATGQMRTSTNGSTWVTVASNFGNTVVNTAAYGDGLWVAAGNTTQMRTSPDIDEFPDYRKSVFDQVYINQSGNLIGAGSAWTTTSSNLTDGAKVGNFSVLVGNNSTIFKTDSNGVYQSITAPATDNFKKVSINENNEVFIIGESGGYYSTDLVSWTTLNLPESENNISNIELL
jgi:hypothetical protein